MISSDRCLRLSGRHCLFLFSVLPSDLCDRAVALSFHFLRQTFEVCRLDSFVNLQASLFLSWALEVFLAGLLGAWGWQLRSLFLQLTRAFWRLVFWQVASPRYVALLVIFLFIYASLPLGQDPASGIQFSFLSPKKVIAAYRLNDAYRRACFQARLVIGLFAQGVLSD